MIPNWVDTTRLAAAGRRQRTGRASGDSTRSSSSCTRATSVTRRISTRSCAPATFLRDLDDLAIMIIGMGARHAELVALAELLEVDQVQFALLPVARRAAAVAVGGRRARRRARRRACAGYVVPSRLYGILAVAQARDRRRRPGERDRAGRRARSVAASSFRRDDPSCSRARFAMRTTGSTTSRRWAPAAANGWSAKADRSVAVRRYRDLLLELAS